MGANAHQHRTLTELAAHRADEAGEAVAFRHVDVAGEVVETTWFGWYDRARAIAAGLVRGGLAPGARVAILARTRIESAVLDLAVMLAGGISVPIYPNELAATCGQLLDDSGAVMAVAENPWQLKKLLDAGAALGDDLQLVLIDPSLALANGANMTLAELGVRARRVQTLDAIEAAGRALLDHGVDPLVERAGEVLPDACATICYTPGTAGQKKGVMLTHGNLIATARGLAQALPLVGTDSQLLYLPLAQAFSRLLLWVGVEAAIVTCFARSFRTVFEDMSRFQPTFIGAVPRLFEKAQEEIELELTGAGGFQALVASWGLHGRRPEGDGLFARMRRDLGGRLVRRQMRERFGGALRFALSGGAPLGLETATFFAECELPVLESYGMVETSAATHVSRLATHAPGTAGTALEGVSFRLADDGELVVRGPGVAPGYWRNPEETRKVFDDEGWFHTGDLARLDERGRLIVTDRKRDIVVTANGKAVAPLPIAEKLRADPLVGQVLIYGDRRPYLTALFSLKDESLRRFADDAGLPGEYEELIRDPAVYAHIDALVDRVNATLAPHETIRKFAILQTELSTEGGELTPMRGLRRRFTTEKHQALLESFYSEQF